MHCNHPLLLAVLLSAPILAPCRLEAAPIPPGQLDLSGTWALTWTDGGHSAQSYGDFARLGLGDPGRFLNVPVPMEIHRALGTLGLVDDPNVGINSLKARWVSEQLWQYQTTFEAPQEVARTARVHLVFDRIETVARVFLNGHEVGRHGTAHRPCRLDVTGRVKPGTNRLSVTVESGLYDVADRPGGDYGAGLDSALNKRHWLRQAQYEFLWDWNPRLINVGLTGGVRLEWVDLARLDQVAVLAEPAADMQSAQVLVRTFVEGFAPGRMATVAARIRETGEQAQATVPLGPGITAAPVTLTMAKPHLWWPRGHGEQPLYTLDVTLTVDDAMLAAATRRFGVRRIELDRSPHPAKGEHFTIRVNGRPVFARGANWVPPDMIPSSVTRDRIKRLLQQAVDANFNLLRIWGGGVFVGHDFLDQADELGLLVWHDFLFACTKYPADDPAFLEEIRKETRFAAREYAHHASLALWCGSNELESANWHWGYDTFGRAFPDYALFHHVIPRILAEEDPARPYWPSSPYSGTYRDPDDPAYGDTHPWNVSLGEAGPDFWAYRTSDARFVSEGGVLGASSPATLRQFLPEPQRKLRSFAWDHHDNAVNFWREGSGLTYRAVDYWLGRDYQQMSLDDYAYSSALLQAEGISELVSNHRRRMFESSGAVFWMFNDSWPTTHGWSIVDYYGRRKLAYHPVRRAFAPVTVVVADEGPDIIVYGINDTTNEWKGALRSGLFALSGGLPRHERRDVTLTPNAARALVTIPRSEWERLGLASHGAFAVLEDASGDVATHRLFLTRFKEMPFVTPTVEITRRGDRAVFRSRTLAWGVTLDLDGETPVSDDCFDLLPGIEHAIPWPKAKPLPKVQRVGNALVRPTSPPSPR